MELLILGGTRFVGRAIADDALSRGWEVTLLHRAETGRAPERASEIRVDRTDTDALAAALGSRRWDAVVDTWAGAPVVVTAAARLLRHRVDRFAYVSTSSVYVWGAHVDESSAVVEADPNTDSVEYGRDKRGAELGVLSEFEGALIARPGLVLGPYENVGRLPWWLSRIAAGGAVVAPGRPGRPLQYIDARDLARCLLDSLERDRHGVFDAIGVSGAATTETLLRSSIDATGSAADLIWIGEDELEAAGAEPWTHLPCWVPEGGEFAGFLEVDTGKAFGAGLRCRPIQETVADAWDWIRRDGLPTPPSGRPAPGLPLDLERALLGSHRSGARS